MSVYFKAFQLPFRKELADTEIGKKQQVILWYILKRKKRPIKAITMSTSPLPAKGHKRDGCVLINMNKWQHESNRVFIIVIKSTRTSHCLLIKMS